MTIKVSRISLSVLLTLLVGAGALLSLGASPASAAPRSAGKTSSAVATVAYQQNQVTRSTNSLNGTARLTEADHTTGSAAAVPQFGCYVGYFTNYWWGTQYHVTRCGVTLLSVGVGLSALFPGAAIAAGIVVAALQAASALSCDGSVNFYETWAGPGAIWPGC
jgi:hypothetical protein